MDEVDDYIAKLEASLQAAADENRVAEAAGAVLMDLVQNLFASLEEGSPEQLAISDVLENAPTKVRQVLTILEGATEISKHSQSIKDTGGLVVTDQGYRVWASRMDTLHDRLTVVVTAYNGGGDG